MRKPIILKIMLGAEEEECPMCGMPEDECECEDEGCECEDEEED